MDPTTPVIIGTAQLNHRDAQGEPIAMMVEAATAALADTGASLANRIDAVRVVGGIWPYRDPGTIVAQRLGSPDAQTTMTVIGGNEVYDLLATTSNDIARGDIDVVVICAAEALRTRRADHAQGRKSAYLTEADDAAPDVLYGVDKPMLLPHEQAAGIASAVSFYAMAETGLRHDLGESPDAHLQRIGALWAKGSAVGAANPSAWFDTASSADEIVTAGPKNRMVSSPYPKLMTSNINVDQAAAVVMCSAATAEAAGVPKDQWIFPHSGSGAADHWSITNRWTLAASPAMRHVIGETLNLAGLVMEEVELLDLYSCFPVAVQIAQREAGIDPDRDWTITGGLTFFGGPLNSYCLHGLARAVELLREGAGANALITGNGGFLTKHSAAVLATTPPAQGYRSNRVQDRVDATPSRPTPTSLADAGTVEAYTAAYGADGEPTMVSVAVISDAGERHFAVNTDRAVIDRLLREDGCGERVALRPGEGEGAAPTAAFD